MVDWYVRLLSEMLRRAVVFTLVLVVAACATACAHQREGGTVNLPGAKAAATVGTVNPRDYLAATETYTTLGATLSRPPTGSSAVSEAVARHNIESAIGPIQPAFVSELALYTNTAFGEIQRDNSVSPTYTGVLVWAFLADGVYAGGSGAMVGPDGQSIAATMPQGTACRAIWLADATTGEYLMGYSSCAPTNLRQSRGSTALSG